MEYKNKKTGVVINVASPVVSPDWVEVRSQKAKKEGSESKGEKGDGDEKGKTDSQKNKKK